jgi:hypothetical protein
VVAYEGRLKDDSTAALDSMIEGKPDARLEGGEEV